MTKEIELGCMCYISCGNCCYRWVVKGSLTMNSTWDMTCCGTSQVHGFSKSVMADESSVSAWYNTVVEIVVCESLGVGHSAVSEKAMAVAQIIFLNCLLVKCGLPGGSYLLSLRSLWLGWSRTLLTVKSANSLGKPKGTLRQPRPLSISEEGSRRPVPRQSRGRGLACGMGKPSVESARSALPPAAGSGSSKEIPMQRHVTVVNRSVCESVCVRE